MMMKQFLLLIVFVCISGTGLMAEPDSYVQKGDKFMKDFCFSLAAEQYKTAADRDTNDIVAWEKLGNAYFILDDYKNAEPVYKVLSTHPLAKVLDKFYYGQVLRANGKYAEAQKAYTAFADGAPTDLRSEEFKNFYESIQPYIEDKKQYDILPLPQNTAASEIGAAFYFEKMIFSSNGDKGWAIKHSDLGSTKPYYDMYELKEGDTSKNNLPKKIKGKVNGRFNEGPATFSSDGCEMIFTRTHTITKGTDHIRKLGLYQADYNDKKGWVNILPLPMNSFTYNVAHPSLSQDGQRLYFSSDMPGGFGETDIYVSEKNDSAWGFPVNLGPGINTAGRELFPFIEDNTRLYFSSDSRVGLGGLDIHSAFLSSHQWIYRTVLGAPINTTADDYGYVTDASGKKGFIVSNRAGGKGSDDIYTFTRHDSTVFHLPTVYFDSSSVGLRDDSKLKLDTVVALMQQYPHMIMEVSGHTSSKGSYEYNIFLSVERANMCLRYLVSKGIEIARLLPVGYGEERLINKCTDEHPCTEVENALNRRAEFKVAKVE